VSHADGGWGKPEGCDGVHRTRSATSATDCGGTHLADTMTAVMEANADVSLAGPSLVDAWLGRIKLPEYTDLFISEGYESVSDLSDLANSTPAQLEDFFRLVNELQPDGKLTKHRFRTIMVNALEALRDRGGDLIRKRQESIRRGQSVRSMATDFNDLQFLLGENDFSMMSEMMDGDTSGAGPQMSTLSVSDSGGAAADTSPDRDEDTNQPPSPLKSVVTQRAPTKPPRSPREVRSNKDAQQEASPVAVPAPTHTATDSQPASQDTPQGTHTPDTQPTDGDGDGDEAQAADSTAGSKDVQDLSEAKQLQLHLRQQVQRNMFEADAKKLREARVDGKLAGPTGGSTWVQPAKGGLKKQQKKPMSREEMMQDLLKSKEGLDKKAAGGGLALDGAQPKADGARMGITVHRNG